MYEGQITDIPRAVYGDPMENSRFSDRWIEDASYLKLKELMVICLPGLPCLLLPRTYLLLPNIWVWIRKQCTLMIALCVALITVR